MTPKKAHSTPVRGLYMAQNDSVWCEPRLTETKKNAMLSGDVVESSMTL